MDFNKLDDYRKFMIENGVVALTFHQEEKVMVLTMNDINEDWDLCIEGIDYFASQQVVYSHESYEDFKTKVTNFFLGVEDK